MESTHGVVANAQLERATSLLDVLVLLAANLKWLVSLPLLAGAVAVGATYLVRPTFTAVTTFLPPQQQQSAAASALASLGALSGLAGVGGGLKSPADQYVSLMQSTTVADRLIDEFQLMAVYESKYRLDARKELASNVRIGLGKKDGLIKIEVDDTEPQRAANLANKHVEELRRMTGGLALSEAQQRRVFFEAQLKQTRDKLVGAQQTLQQSGFSQGALRAEPKAAAEGYAKLKAETTAAEVRLQTLRRGLADTTPEVLQQQTLLGALRGQLTKLESAAGTTGDSDYIGKYRDFKYQETLFDLFARQYELARLDESREGALIQVIDPALVPERKSKPARMWVGGLAALGALVLCCGVLIMRSQLKSAAASPQPAPGLADFKAALFGRKKTP
jgi:uncharacterized protein involved in exopolysaccharide biosynthesis